jgi:acetyltransferase-like isoleucine patch superfamily enzyme
MAAVFSPPFYGCVPLATYSSRGYFAASATFHHSRIRFGRNLFIGNRVLIYEDHGGGTVEIGSGVHLHRDVTIQTGQGGSVTIGDDTHVQPRCQFSAYVGATTIGKRVEIAPNCAFYPYDHGVDLYTPIRGQPLQTRGGIVVEDDAWLGFGVVVLDGVRIGKGAVIGAGSVVTSDVPDNAIAVGVPARVVKNRTSIRLAEQRAGS